MKNKSTIFVTILILAAFFVFRHHGTPTLSMPSTAVAQGSNVRVPVFMKPLDGEGQQWTLTMRQARQYYVNVYNNRKLVVQFAAGIAKNPDPTGSTFGTQGDIQFDGVLYHAKRLHVDRDGKQGYIVFQPDPSTVDNTTTH